MAIEASHEVVHIIVRVQMSGNIDLEGNENEKITRESNMEGCEPPPLPPPINKKQESICQKS